MMDKEESGPRVVRAPKCPTQAERDAHEALHIPHADWCEVCVRGRGRNKPLIKKKIQRHAPKDLYSQEGE